MKNGDMPASPTVAEINRETGYFEEKQVSNHGYMLFGLTKREMFAMSAMQAILSNPSLIDICSNDAVDFVRFNSVRIANSVLDELAKEQEK